MEKEIICVNMYGGKGLFGGKEQPLNVDIIFCGKYKECSYYKNNKCLAVRSFGGGHCKHGSIQNVMGYTSRARKHYEFKSKWQKHEKYNTLDYPSTKLGLIDNEVVFPYPHIQIKKNESGDVIIEGPAFFGSSIPFVDYEKFTPKLINKICKFRPQAMMGGEIISYQKETVPLFLAHLKEVLPDRYKEFISEYKDFETDINYVGRKALLKTVSPSFVHYESRNYPSINGINEKWYWDGEVLTYEKGYVSSFNITGDYKVKEIKIEPSDKSTIKISSNEQVTKDTVFVD